MSFIIPAVISRAIGQPTSHPYETRFPRRCHLTHRVIPSSATKIERDFLVKMDHGMNLTRNILCTPTGELFPYILSMTSYGTNQALPDHKPDTPPLPTVHSDYLGYCQAHNTLAEYDSLIDQSKHAIYSGDNHASYLQISLVLFC